MQKQFSFEVPPSTDSNNNDQQQQQEASRVENKSSVVVHVGRVDVSSIYSQSCSLIVPVVTHHMMYKIGILQLNKHINRIGATVPLTGQGFGVLFLGGHISPKNRS